MDSAQVSQCELVMTQTYLERGDAEYYLGLGQRNFVQGKRTGLGGKFKELDDLNIRARAMKEIWQEARIVVFERDLKLVGLVHVYKYDAEGRVVMIFHVYSYTTRTWYGTPQDTAEIKDGKWYTELPYAEMFPDSPYSFQCIIRGNLFETYLHMNPDGSFKHVEVVASPDLMDY